MASGSRSPDDPTPAQGRLTVEVPHWTATVRIYDNQYQPVAGVDAVTLKPHTAQTYQVETSLPPGIYEVETSLAEQTERQVVAVHAHKAVTIARDTWALTLPSVAPLTGTATTRASHSDPAGQWSRQTTGAAVAGGDSGLFLFVRTLNPAQYASFAEGLSLLDADGNLLTTFSDGVVKNEQEGWMAFNADLPAGFYILRRGRTGVRVRYQPLYLCAGWETQVFLESSSHPSLRTLTLNMARRGTGFRPNDETMVAAEAVLNALQRGGSGAAVVSTEKMTTLLHGKLENPWLGILAAYALLRAQEEQTQQPTSADQRNADLLGHMLNFLTDLGDHPDVRALRLRDDRLADTSFWYPPLLQMGLNRVRHYATQSADLIPLHSLTDCILDNVLANSAWTQWRQLDRMPQPGSISGLRATEQVNKLAIRKPTAAAVSPITAAFYQAAPVNAPVFRVDQAPPSTLPSVIALDSDLEAGPESRIASDDPSDGIRNLQQPSTLDTISKLAAPYDAPLIQIAQQLTHSRNMEALPETVTLDSTSVFAQRLETVSAKDVSVAWGISLARTEEALKHLRESSARLPVSVVQESPTERALAPAKQAILEYVLQQSEQSDDPRALDDDPAAEPPVAADLPAETSSEAERATGIEGCVTKLRGVAQHLLLGMTNDHEVEDSTRQVRALADDLQRVADEIATRADFVVLIDQQGRMLGNRLFLVFLSPPFAVDSPDAYQTRETQRQAWEIALSGAPLGSSTLPDPVRDVPARTWRLQRTAIHDSATNTVQAYLHVLRRSGTALLSEEARRQIEVLSSKLTLYAGLFTDGSAAYRDQYIQQLTSLTEQLHALVRSEAPPEPMPLE